MWEQISWNAVLVQEFPVTALIVMSVFLSPVTCLKKTKEVIETFFNYINAFARQTEKAMS